MRMLRYFIVLAFAAPAYATPPVKPAYPPTTATGTPNLNLGIDGYIDETDTTVSSTGSPHPVSQSKPLPVQITGGSLQPAAPGGSTTITTANTWQTFIAAGQAVHGCYIQNNNTTAAICVGWPITSSGVQTAQSGSYTCPGTSGGAQVTYLAPGTATQCMGPYTAAIVVSSPTVGAGIWGGAN